MRKKFKVTKVRKAHGGFSSMTVGDVASRALRMANTVRKLINVEKKYFDATQVIANTGFTSTGIVYHLTATTQGDTSSNRDGDSIKLTSEQFKIGVQVGSTNTQIRIILFQDNENAGTNPGITDLLEANNVYSPLLHTNGRRFKVLHDIYDSLNTVNSVNKHYNFYEKMDSHIKYNGAGTREGNIYIAFLSEQATGAASPTGYIYNRIRFIDN